MKQVVIIDYGMGNLHSVTKALQALGARVQISQDPQEVMAAQRVILPGVGAFPDAMALLFETGLDKAAKAAAAAGKPFLGICLGMQLLLDSSDEGGCHEGLSLIPGKIERIRPGAGYKIPHMGWNEVEDRQNCPLLQGVSGEDFYFVHSYGCLDAASPAAAGVTDYGTPFASVVWNGKNVFGTQFHPEKSGLAGRKLLQNFLNV